MTQQNSERFDGNLEFPPEFLWIKIIVLIKQEKLTCRMKMLETFNVSYEGISSYTLSNKT